jgi:hypothetical protein
VANHGQSNLAIIWEEFIVSYKVNDIIMIPNNSGSPKTAFANSTQYSKTLTNNVSIAEPFNFSNSENFLYARADLMRNFVQPNKSRLKLISDNQDKNVSALDFVVDAFEDFRVFLKNKKFKKLVDDPIIKQDWRAESGWEDIDIFYGEKMNNVYQAFVREYLVPSGKEKEITNFEDFMRIFFNRFFKELDIPLTKTGFMSSRLIGPQFSGLCIQINNSDVTRYANKYNNFVNSKNFETFSLAAAQFGFMVDYHVPWRLVANLNSPKLFPYILDRIKIAEKQSTTLNTFGNSPSHSHEYTLDDGLNGVTTSLQQGDEGYVDYHVHEIKNGQLIQSQFYSDELPNSAHIHNLSFADNSFLKVSDVYNIYFYKTSLLDIETLKIYLLDMYNTFVSNFPASLDTEYCKGSGYASILNAPATKPKAVTREPIDMGAVNQEYDSVFWLKLYFNIRIKETGAQVTDKQVSNALKIMEEFYFSVDNMRAIKYINDYLKQFY